MPGLMPGFSFSLLIYLNYDLGGVWLVSSDTSPHWKSTDVDLVRFQTLTTRKVSVQLPDDWTHIKLLGA